jgi:hypothetical protein
MAIEAFEESAETPFREWQRATAALHAAERRGADHLELVTLSEAVIRAHHEVVLHRAAAGEDMAGYAERDAALLDQSDDRNHPEI